MTRRTPERRADEEVNGCVSFFLLVFVVIPLAIYAIVGINHGIDSVGHRLGCAEVNRNFWPPGDWECIEYTPTPEAAR